MYYIVLTRNDSCGPIFQEKFEIYSEAKARFDVLKEHYTFCKLAIVIEEQ